MSKQRINRRSIVTAKFLSLVIANISIVLIDMGANRTHLTSASGYVQMIKDNIISEDEKKIYIDIVLKKQKTINYN